MTKRMLQVHGIVVLEGSVQGIKTIKQQLRRHYRCYQYRDDAMTVEEVAEPEMPQLEEMARRHGVAVQQIRGTHDVEIIAEAKPSIKIDLIAGQWYRTNQEAFPLIHVTNVWHQISPEGEEIWLFDVDLVDVGSIPMPATLDAKHLATYGLKSATLEDFESLGIAPPAGFEPSPHSVPSPEPQKIEGASLPQAQVAKMALLDRWGHRIKTATLQRAGTKGFYVEATVSGSTNAMPGEIAKTRVLYRS